MIAISHITHLPVTLHLFVKYIMATRKMTVTEPPKKRRMLDKRLCPPCSSMLSISGIKALSSTQGYRHHDKAACKSNAAQGCQLCSIIYKEMVNSLPPREGLIFSTYFRSSRVSLSQPPVEGEGAVS